MAGGEGAAAAGVPTQAEMDPGLSRGGGLPSFEFAFNSENFSDRVLRLEVVASDSVAGGPLPDLALHREDLRLHKEEADGKIIDSSCTMVSAPVLRVKTVYINSVVLAANSPFFRKIFSNGMKESDQRHITLQVADSGTEETVIMEILSFMYTGKLSTTEPNLLLDILMAADKFEVLACMRHCNQLLTNLPMTRESALLYLYYPCSTSVAAEIRHLTNAAKEFLASKYKVLAKFSDELMDMPLAGIEAIFSSTDLQTRSEDTVYSFLLEWACKQYPETEERHKIWSSSLLPLVRFSHMTWSKLHEVLTCGDDGVDREQTKKLITDALLHKAYPAHEQGTTEADTTNCWQVPQRAYRLKPIKVVEFDRPCPQVIVYLDLTREECSRLFPEGHISTHLFHLAGQDFRLMAYCEMDEQDKAYSFGLFIATAKMTRGPTCLTVDFEFAARTRSSGKFVTRWENKYTFGGDWMLGCSDLFEVPWSTFIANDNLFIDDVLHLRADLRALVAPPGLQA
ncbi:BTB/POZ domain-containing protein At2g46260-like [Hordeum vulgare subsp. vulgare]|uniref:BTB domain-containing protein n=1 Tax=Hordeum vulgare subsp. vulgare TaxID=112509 RepID=A0A8I6Y7U7_HORVV|nr:BTB/POZ domain-containing protein At2g46260-like [Hordeum vulgare subsp. vulgare]